MGKNVRNNGVTSIVAAVVTLALMAMTLYVLFNPESKSSNVQIEETSSMQVAKLQKLCKVWGFVKYHHPEVVAGKVDWDRELFKMIPVVLEINEDKEMDKALHEWIIAFGEPTPGTAEKAGEVHLAPTTAWIADERYVTTELSGLLVKLSKTYFTDRTKAYVSFDKENLSEYKNEKAYIGMNYADDGYRLLGLFRYWNIVEYYYPYKDIIGEDWDQVLAEFIPKFLEESDELSYKLAIMELTTKIHDSHVMVSDKSGTLNRYWGWNRAPFRFMVVEDKVVITAKSEKYASESGVQIGDVVLKIDGKDIADVIKKKTKFVSLSRADSIVKNLQYYLFKTPKASIAFTLERDGKQLEENVVCHEGCEIGGYPKESHKLLEGNIGYINPGVLKNGEIDSILKKFIDTKGLIIDLRYYPSTNDFIDSIGDFLLPRREFIARFTTGNQAVPGEFIFLDDAEAGNDNPDYYKGKVMVLMDECTQSYAEFTVMACRMSPNALVIGSHSIGSDGTVVNFSLPGGIETRFTGIGVYNPDGSETQRVGLTPDITVNPTILGIREGRDELIEKAIELINQ